jgi:hypothetical protein
MKNKTLPIKSRQKELIANKGEREKKIKPENISTQNTKQNIGSAGAVHRMRTMGILGIREEC